MLRLIKERLVTKLMVNIGTVNTINSQSVTVTARDSAGNVTACFGIVTITDGGAGYAKGCRYVKTNAAAGVDGVYENIGTTSSCQFITGGQDVPGSITLNNGQIIVGNASNVGAGVAMSGDTTIDNTGAVTIGSSKVSVAKHASDAMAEATVTLTANQVKALFATPITLVAAQGAGTYIVVDEIRFKLAFTTTQYAGANALEFRYTNGSGAKVTADISSGSLNSNATAYRSVKGVTTELTPVLNAPVVVAVPVANPTNGDSPVTLVVRYHVVTP